MQAGNLVENKGFLCLLIFPLHVSEGKLVDKLNFHEGNLEDKG